MTLQSSTSVLNLAELEVPDSHKFVIWNKDRGADTPLRELYQLSPLDLSKAEVRLLRLTHSQGELRGRLSVASLDDLSTYTAVSYTWLEDVPTSYMICNGIRVPITSSLRSALLRFRSAGNRMFWIDQICIDQSNSDEQTYQINLMTQIYTVASRVLVWIGESDQDTATAFDFAFWLSTTFYSGPAVASLMGWIPTKINEALQSLPRDRGKWVAWMRLLSRPWFRRVWIMQEVSHCVDTQVYCGEYRTHYQSLWGSFVTLATNPKIRETAFGMIGAYSGKTSALQEAMNVQAIIDGLGLQMPIGIRLIQSLHFGSEPRPLELFRALCMTRTRHCKRPEDKINGVLVHLASYANIFDPPRLSYTLSAGETYARIARFLFTKGIGIHVLLQAGLQQHQEIDLPSWCPDFSTPKPTPVFAEAQRGEQVRAGTSQPESFSKWAWMSQDAQEQSQTQPGRPNVVDIGPTDDTIILKASIVDAIATVGPVRLGRMDQNSIEQTMDIESFITWDAASSQSVERSPTKSNRYAFKSARISAYIRTIIAVDALSQRAEIKDPDITYHIIRNAQFPSDPQKVEQIGSFVGLNVRSTLNRRIGMTTRGYIGLFPGCAQPGDKVCVAPGCDFPLVLRRTARNPPLIVDARRKWTFQLVGDAYIHEMFKKGKLADRNIERSDVPMYLL